MSNNIDYAMSCPNCQQDITEWNVKELSGQLYRGQNYRPDQLGDGGVMTAKCDHCAQVVTATVNYIVPPKIQLKVWSYAKADYYKTPDSPIILDYQP